MKHECQQSLYTPVPPSCGWFDIDSFPDEGGPAQTLRCESGKPATFRNCGLRGIPVCEDHKCRCAQPLQGTSIITHRAVDIVGGGKDPRE